MGDAASGEVGDRGVRAGVGVGPERVLAEGPMVRAIPSSPTSPQAVRTAPPPSCNSGTRRSTGITAFAGSPGPAPGLRPVQCARGPAGRSTAAIGGPPR
jgi:hypothetical protein